MLLYMLGIIVPPLAILLYGKILYAALNGVLWAAAIMTPGMMGLFLWLCASAQASYMIHNVRLGKIQGHDYSL